MKFSLVTPEKVVLDDQDIEDFLVPGYEGELNILEDHTPLLTSLSVGVLKYKLKGEPSYQEVVVTEGYCEVFPTKILVLAETAEKKEDIDVLRAERAYDKASKKLSCITELSPEAIEEQQARLKKAHVRKTTGTKK